MIAPPAHQATATATITNGKVVWFTLTSGGSGYMSTPIVTITGGGGTGATATATIEGGVVTGVSVNNPGTGYTSAPTVTIAAPSNPVPLAVYNSTQATATTNLTATGVASINLSRGHRLYLVANHLDHRRRRLRRGGDRHGRQRRDHCNYPDQRRHRLHLDALGLDHRRRLQHARISHGDAHRHIARFDSADLGRQRLHLRADGPDHRRRRLGGDGHRHRDERCGQRPDPDQSRLGLHLGPDDHHRSPAGRLDDVPGLTITATISAGGSSVGLIKTGTGVLNLSGSSSNTYTGTTSVNEGTVLLNDVNGANAIGAASALIIGDNVGGPNADVVRLLSSNQIAPSATVLVNDSGQLDLNNFTNAIGSLGL